MQGRENEATAQALRAGRIHDLPVRPAEQALLDFVVKLTRNAWRIVPDDVGRLRDAGWTDPQVAEAVYIGSFFNMMVRIADAFGAMPPPVTDRDGVPAAVTRDTDDRDWG